MARPLRNLIGHRVVNDHLGAALLVVAGNNPSNFQTHNFIPIVQFDIAAPATANFVIP
jgi:hypothetical protein